MIDSHYRMYNLESQISCIEQFIIVDAPDLVDLANDLATYFVDFAGPLCALRRKHMECMACSSEGTPEKSIKFLFWRIRCNL
jgi:hypothetical protein